MSVYFISGIDTDAGKSVATGIIAGSLAARGLRVITQKLVQTGCTGLSEDILTHRRLMGIAPTAEDREGTTCPYVFTYPSSPHLAAEIDGAAIDLDLVTAATRRLAATHDVVLVEGAGGLHVPVTRDTLTVDYIQERGYPLLLVTSARLGSINHTLLTLEVCRRRGIPLAALVFNHYPIADAPIAEDTRALFRAHVAVHHPGAAWLEIPVMGAEPPVIDTTPLLP
jgi:dethiobiotin synthetase